MKSKNHSNIVVCLEVSDNTAQVQYGTGDIIINLVTL